MGHTAGLPGWRPGSAQKKPAGAMGHTAGLPGRRPGASAKKQPAGAMDGPAGVKKVAGTGFEPVTSRL